MFVGESKTAERLESDFNYIGLENPKFQLGAVKRYFHETGN